MKNLYDVLEIDKNASDKDIKKAFHKLSQKYHPDVNKDEEAVQKYKEITQAYEVLSDAAKKMQYDRFGSIDGNSKPFDGPYDDIFSQFFGRQRSVLKGKDIKVIVPVSIKQAIYGDEVDIFYKKHSLCKKCAGLGGEFTVCSKCSGSGVITVQSRLGRGVVVQTTCNICQGQGKKLNSRCSECVDGLVDPVEHSIKIQIPPGIDTGMAFVNKNQGEPIGDGVPGDLHVVFEVEEHKLLNKVGNGHVVLEYPFTYSQLVKGCKIDIPTLEGVATVDIPAGTQPGSNFKLKNMGFPVFNYNMSTYHRGDQLVTVKLYVPKDVNSDYLELINKLQDLDKNYVSPKLEDINRVLGETNE